MGNPVYIVLVSLFLFTEESYSATDTTYRAAVVEYHPVQNYSLSPDERRNANVDKYIELVNTLSDKNFDILVYPESTITSGVSSIRETLLDIAVEVPDQSQNIKPCALDTYPNFLKKLSCLAAELNTYLVVNLIEKEKCESSENCAGDSWNMYNTNVAFDRTGVIIQRYRKYNPFGEPEINITAKAEVATFETDFGVTFGLFTCFDILFEEPALSMVRQGVKHLIFPSMWFSELPFLTALQAQNMFAIENDVVILAAGANSARRGSGGTGIYQGELGPVVYDIISNDSNKVYVADVLKEWTVTSAVVPDEIPNDDITDQLAFELENFHLIADNLSLYNSHPVFDKEFDGVLETDGISCAVSWKIAYENITDTHYDYVFLYFSGMRSFSGVRNGAIDVCGLVFCQDLLRDGGGYESCGKRYLDQYQSIHWPYTIQELSISANFTASTGTAQFPTIVTSAIRPLNRADYEWSSRYFNDGKTVEKTLKLLKPQNRLLTFAIYGRDYARENAAISLELNTLLLVAVVALTAWKI